LFHVFTFITVLLYIFIKQFLLAHNALKISISIKLRRFQTIEQPIIINTDFLTIFRSKLYSLDTYYIVPLREGGLK